MGSSHGGQVSLLLLLLLRGIGREILTAFWGEEGGEDH